MYKAPPSSALCLKNFVFSLQVEIGNEEAIYLKELIYHGFYCFEALTQRDLDSVVCGICGVCPEVCLGDGNEKNCCSTSQVL